MKRALAASILGGAMLLAAPALAQDDEESDDAGGLFGIGDIDIDLGDERKGDAQEISYEGMVERQAPEFAEGKAVTITHYGGNIRVRCSDREGINARVAYTIYGTNGTNMERMGKGVGLTAWGNSSSGGVKTKTPYKSSGVNRADIELTVSLPEEAYITVVGGSGWVQVSGCKGAVKSSNKANGAHVDGIYSRVNVSSSSGDVNVQLDEGSHLDGSSKISAPGGNATMTLPNSFGGKFYAKGSEVDVAHTVMGTNESALVQGTISTGDASLAITARDKVEVKLP